MPTPLSGAKFLQQSSNQDVPHTFGFIVPRTVPGDLLFAVRNGITDAEDVFTIDLDGNLVMDGTAAIEGNITAAGAQLGRRLRVVAGDISPAAGLNHDVDPGEVAHLRIMAQPSNSTITGFTGGEGGRTLFVTNVGTGNLILAENDNGSVAANRIRIANNLDATIAPDAGVTLIYDGAVSRWRLVLM